MTSVAESTSPKEGVALKFVNFHSSIHPSFWSGLEDKKLNDWRLSTEPRVIQGTYQPAKLKDLPPTISISSDAFDGGPAAKSKAGVAVHGVLHLVNTIEEFKKLDKKALLKTNGEKILDSQCDGKKPTYSFVLLVHADVKKHKYIYWFGFPAWTYPDAKQTTTVSFARNLSSDEKQQLSGLIETKVSNKNLNQSVLAPIYVLHKNELWCFGDDNENIKTMTSKASWEKYDTKLLFLDPSASEKHPGWPLRVFLDILNKRYNFDVLKMKVLCVRGDIVGSNTGHGSGTMPSSIVLDLNLVDPKISRTVATTFLGWELNSKNRAMPRLADLGASMDPSHLAMSSADLNVKLMRWRMLPNLNTDEISKLKCLLLGAGTFDQFYMHSIPMKILTHFFV